MTFLRLTDLPVAGKRVFIRADLNVPQDDAGNITEDTRIRASIPGIEYALKGGAAVMVTSHLGRPTEGRLAPEDSLAPVAKRLGEMLGRPVRLIANWVDGGFEVTPGEAVMLENCRVNKGEKKNDEALARKMAALCDVYVNDAFGTAHRAEATTHGLARFAPVACAAQQSRAATGRHRRRRQGVDQAHHPEITRREGGPVDRRRGHRQYFHARRGARHREIARGAGAGGGCARRHGGDARARRARAAAGGRRRRQ
jgi:hypothetical protein